MARISRLDSNDVLSIADLRRLARGRLPRVVFDYIDGGADDEVTLARSTRVYDDVFLRPRSAVVTPDCDLRTTVLGTELALPFLLGPIGSTRMFYPRGESAAARAAGQAGTAYTLSTLSGSTLEEVRSASTGPLWYQLYLIGGRAVATKAIVRARAAGYKALVVTIDTPVAGNRERDTRDGTGALLTKQPFKLLPYSGQFLSRPRWLLDFFRDGGLMRFPNVVLDDGPMGYADIGAALAQSAVAWADLQWIRKEWNGPIVVKGVHTGDDARRAVNEGAEAIVVSNHGGRQLDGVAPTLRVLPEVVAAVHGQTEILMDGGIRRGSDIVKALCLGADAVLIGRAYAYGVAAAGEAGAARAIEILRTELVRTMKLLGCPAVGELDRSFVEIPTNWQAPASLP